MSRTVTGSVSFSDYIGSHVNQHNVLPLVHSSRCEYFDAIRNSDSLSTQPCPVFSEPLVYLFYGRPAYRSRRGAQPDTSIQYCPICFIFKAERFSAPLRRVFPFDSGAAAAGRFSPIISASDVHQFELHASLEHVRKHVHLFFETNEAYFLGRARGGLIIPPTPEEARKYYDLVTRTGSTVFDDRRSAIEVQCDFSLSLRDSLWAVVLPLSFLRESGVRQKIVEDWGAFPITYSTVFGSTPAEYSATIRQKYEDWLRQGDFLP